MKIRHPTKICSNVKKNPTVKSIQDLQLLQSFPLEGRIGRKRNRGDIALVGALTSGRLAISVVIQRARNDRVTRSAD